LKHITFSSIKSKISNIYPDKNLAMQLIDINSNSIYQLIKQYRNILSHRSTPGRQIHRAIGGKSKPSLWNEEIELSESLTRNIKNWVFGAINNLLDEIYSFSEELNKIAT